MRETTIRQLIDALEEAAGEHGDDTPVRLAHQPHYPLQYYISDEPRFWKGVLYIKESDQVGGYTYDNGTVPNNSPYLPRHIFGDPPEEQCDNCGSYAVVGTVALGGQADREYICHNCLIGQVPQSVAETYEGDLPLQVVMEAIAAATEA